MNIRTHYGTNDIVNIFTYLLLFVIWPFFAFLLSLFRYNKIEAKIIFVLFTALYGYSMIANSEDLDLYRYLHWIENFRYDVLDWSDFTVMVTAVNISEGVSMDIYRDVMAFFVSRFTSDGHIFMLFLGIVFGIAYVKTLSQLLSIYDNRSFWGGILLFSYSFAFSLDWLGGVRFGTAAYVYLIGALHYITGQYKKAYIYFPLSFFIHFGFIVGVLILLVYKYLQNHTKQINILLIASFCFSSIFLILSTSLASFIGGRIAEVLNSYTDGRFLEYASGDGVPWYSRIHNMLPLLFIYLFIFILNKRHSFKETNISFNAFIFLISSLIVVNFFSFSPIFSERFVVLSFALFYIYLYSLYVNNEHNGKLSKYILYSFACYTLHIVNALRYIFEYTTPSFYSPLLLNVITSQETMTMWYYLFGS